MAASAHPALAPASFNLKKPRGPAKFNWSLYGMQSGSDPDKFGPDFEEMTAEDVPAWWKKLLSIKLRVPVKSCTVKEINASGRSGCRYFQLQVVYNGSVTNPTLGFPTDLFVKARRPEQQPTEFAPEFVVPRLLSRMDDSPLMPSILWADADVVIMPDMTVPCRIHRGFAPRKSCDVKMEEYKEIMGVYAHLHAISWGLPDDIEGLREHHGESGWVNSFTGDQIPQKYFEALLEMYDFPNKDLVLQARKIGMWRVFDYMTSHAKCLVQGDAHLGQLMHTSGNVTPASSANLIKECWSRKPDNSRSASWALMDFGHAMVANPAIDIGAFLSQIQTDQIETGGSPHIDVETLLNSYWVSLTGRLPKEKVQMSFEQFHCDVNIVMAWRTIMCLFFKTFYEAHEDEECVHCRGVGCELCAGDGRRHGLSDEEKETFVPHAKELLSSHLKDATFTQEVVDELNTQAVLNLQTLNSHKKE